MFNQVHAYIISTLRKDMPSMFGKDSKKKELIKGLDGVYTQIQREHQISPGDFPDLKKMQVTHCPLYGPKKYQHHNVWSWEGESGEAV